MPTRRSSGAFTLVEVLIVVVVLGILAAIVVPQFSVASEESRRNALNTHLYTMRSQLELYKIEHDGHYPTDHTRFSTQMTAGTTAHGSPGSDLGPYLLSVPVNPFSDADDITFDAAPAASLGWHYDASTSGLIRANDSKAHRAL